MTALAGNLWTFISEHGYDGADFDWSIPRRRKPALFTT